MPSTIDGELEEWPEAPTIDMTSVRVELDHRILTIRYTTTDGHDVVVTSRVGQQTG